MLSLHSIGFGINFENLQSSKRGLKFGMALKYYRNKVTSEERRSLKPLGPEWEEILVAPNQKFMVSSDPEKGKSKLKDQDKILRARARNHSRDHDIDDNIQLNTANGLTSAVKANLLNSKGEKRRKIDDL